MGMSMSMSIGVDTNENQSSRLLRPAMRRTGGVLEQVRIAGLATGVGKDDGTFRTSLVL